MKKALVITYYWPPSGGAGVQRWLKFVKYMRDFGWEPVVYTPENPEFPETDPSLARDIPEGLTVIRRKIWEPYDLYKRFIGRKKNEKISAAFTSETKRNGLPEAISVWLRGNFFIPDARRFWIRPSVSFLGKYLAANPVDAIISTGPPHSMHLIALHVARSQRIPWLADFRDPWTNIDFYKDLHLTLWADRKHRTLEKEVLLNATAISVISNGMAQDLGVVVRRDYDVITNGFDPEDLPAEKSVSPDIKFSISHIGTLPASRNPQVLWDALKEIIAGYPSFAADLEIKLVGKVDFSILRSAEEAGLLPFVQRIDYLPHDQVVLCQRQSQLLLLVINNTPNAGMILTGKFFEYLAAGRPILCIGPKDGDAATVLEETGAGLIAGFTETALMKRHLLQYYEAYKRGELSVETKGVNTFSRRELTGKLVAVLDRITR